MNRFRPRIDWLALVLLASTTVATGEEPVRAFLDGLRARGYHDVALEYLDQLGTNPSTPADLAEVLDLEKAITLLAGSREERDRIVRQQQLDEAQGLLSQFVKNSPGHERANRARAHLANLVAERARMHVEAASRGNPTEELSQANKLYAEARRIYADHQKTLRKELEQIPKVLDRSDPRQEALAERRTQLRADYVQTRLSANAILEESAETVPEGQARNAVLEEAGKVYEDIYKKYRTRLAGLYARLYQGRVNQKLEKFRDALGFYVELLDQPDSPEPFRVLKTKTLRLAIDCWLHPSQNKYVEAITRCSEWVATATPQEDRQPEWLYLRLSLARAYLAQADANPEDRRLVLASRNAAEKQAKMVARYESQYQPQALMLIADLGGPKVPTDNEVETFEDARKSAKEALDIAEATAGRVAEIGQSVRTNDDAGTRDELEKKYSEARQALKSARDDAVDRFRLALRFADRETPSEDLNLVRYFLAYLYHQRGDFHEAALMGSFVAQRYPGSSSARQCAKISMASYVELHRAAEGDRQFETESIVAIATFILAHWPEYAEAEEALATLIPFAINDNQLEQAIEYFDRIPSSSPQKGPAALTTGMAVWQSYLAGVQEWRDGQQGTPPAGSIPEELLARRASAYKYLKSGFDQTAAEGPRDRATVTAILCLAQASLENGEHEFALSILEDTKRGPLTLVRAKHSSTEVPGLLEDTYKAALQAHISTFSSGGNTDAVIRRTQEIMQELTAAVAESEDGQQRVTRIYMEIARELEQQLRVAAPDAKQAISRGFETFLTQLSARATELSVLNWVAETFASLAAGFDKGATADRYYQASENAFRNLLKRVNLEPDMRIQIQVRLARVLRSQGRFGPAMDLLTSVLREKNTLLNVQLEAAETLQHWGVAEKGNAKASLFERAIQGESPDPRSRRNTVWGWGLIAKLTANRPKLQDIFHRARLSISNCRLRLAETKQGDERKRLLEMAEKDISLTQRLYGLGNERWKARYDALLKQIQQSKGERPVGLQG